MFASIFGSRAQGSSAEYDLLASSEWGGAAKQLPLSVRASRVLRHRRIVVALASVLVGTVLLVVYLVSFRAAEVPWQITDKTSQAHVDTTLPPLYPEFHREELQLPQHDLRNPFANGKKYLWVANHVQCTIRLLLILGSH